jgi:hypothetical protein
MPAATWACAELLLTNPTTGIAECCAHATKDQVAAPLSRVIKSRRLIVAPEDRTAVTTPTCTEKGGRAMSTSG